MGRTEGSVKTVITAGLALILTACGQGPSASDNAPVPSDHSVVGALTALRVSGDEVEPYVGFAEMGESADVVAWASMTSVAGVRAVGGGPAEGDTAYLLQVVVTPERANPQSGPLTMELMMPSATAKDAAVEADRISLRLPSEPPLLFLRDKGGGETGLYRPVNSRGLWLDSPDGPQAPLADEDLTKDPRYGPRLKQSGSVAGLAAEVLESD